MHEQLASLSAGETLFAWHEDTGSMAPVRARSGRLSVADSWFVGNGTVRRLDLHLDRFSAACHTRYGVPVSETGRFLDAVCAKLPRAGQWFPRIEFEQGAGFRLRLRPAPERGGEVTLWVCGQVDGRQEPTVKGPDLGMLAALRKDAVRRGADEALLTTGSGIVLEGALSSILWWRGDVLCAPPLSLPVLPGVTRAILLDLAVKAGIEISYERCRPADLSGTEIWSVSALHGIRAVTGWVQPGLAAGTPRRIGRWEARLAVTEAPIARHPSPFGRASG